MAQIDLQNISARVPEYRSSNRDQDDHTYDAIIGRRYQNTPVTTNPNAKARESTWRSEVIVTRRMIVIAVIGIVLLSTLFSIITGIIIYTVTTANMEDHSKLNQQLTSTTPSSELTDSLSLEITLVKQDLARLSKMWNEGKDRGSTYIRWGKTNCSGNGTELVYSGYAGGSYYNHGGSGSNYLCLPGDPQWGKYEDALQEGGLVYGAEYQFQSKKWFQNTATDNDVPCAVCRSPSASTLMVPGRNTCYDTWTMEYHGYLMSENYRHSASDYVCLDEHPESVVGSNANLNGKLFYTVEGRCGSLPCPPYVNGRELTCVVCSK